MEYIRKKRIYNCIINLKVFGSIQNYGVLIKYQLPWISFSKVLKYGSSNLDDSP